ncbi:hypothetical protein [Lysinibacillus xylanilyticus]|uniref:hypothetical protein n=1 Tax=Lysinibacillus xylanilyticus TaxID=582475 RepID=UPI003D00FE2E
MKIIEYKNIRDREVNGLFYIKRVMAKGKSFEEDDTALVIVMTPDNKIIKPPYDYIVYLRNKRTSKFQIEKIAIAICHYYNFLLLHKLTGEEQFSNEILNAYIEHLSFLPKGLSKMPGYLSVHPSDIDTFPVHPYIEGIENRDTIKKIYNEWYKRLKKSNTVHFVDPQKHQIEVDEEGWRYSFEYIVKTVRSTLDYLDWLSKDDIWSRRYKEIDKHVVSKITIKTERYVVYVWDIAKRVTTLTNLKLKDNSISKKRVFTESEIEKILTNKLINSSAQKKFLLHLLLHTGIRISELLNLLLAEGIVGETGRGTKKSYEIKWEELLSSNPHFNVVSDYKMDILIDSELDFYIRIKKRRNYESSTRKNKKNETRYIRLRDHYDLVNVLDLDGYGSIFVQQLDIYQQFKNELFLYTKEQHPTEFIENIISYYKEMKSKGIVIDDPNFDAQYRTWIYLIREIIEKSYFGTILKEHLIERHQKIKFNQFNKNENKEYLFLSEREYRRVYKPLEPYVVNDWLNKIFENCEISRYDGDLNLFTKHNIKRTLSVHTFRHTYITYRIGFESLSGVFNFSSIAQLKKEVGHVLDSEVTLSRYYFLDKNRKKKARSAIYQFLRGKILKDNNGGE